MQRNAFGEMDYSESALGEAVDKPQLIGDIVQHWQKLANGKPTVCFATNIKHSQHIVEQFKAAGVTAEHIDCYTDEDERRAILDRVLSGKTKVISNVGILCEGWDFPACEVMILARPTRSRIRWIQMAGRILRPFEGKERALILDHSGSAAHLGYPTDDLPLELCDGTNLSSQSKPREESKPKKCPKCSFMKPPKVHVCPVCSFAPEKPLSITHNDGSLHLVKRKKAKMEDKQAVYSQLQAIRFERGYKSKWVDHQYKNYFGVWPRGLQSYLEEPTSKIRSWVQSQTIRHAKSKEVRHAA
jgi:superfamily II DNA or RNA helicase